MCFISFCSLIIPLLNCYKFQNKKTKNQITQQIRINFHLQIFFGIIFLIFIFLNTGYYTILNEENLQSIGFKHIAKSFQFVFKSKYYGLSYGCENESIAQGRAYFNKNIGISYCFFSRSSIFSGDGGVIYVNSGSLSMNVNSSVFYSCFCSSKGGAIDFMSANSYLRMVCANKCIASSQFHFAHIIASQNNQLEYLSLSYCPDISSGKNPLYLESGNQRIENTNSSMNNDTQYSGIRIWTPNSFTSSFCTFSNNRVSGYTCIYLYSISGTISMLFAIIVHNNSPILGVVYVDGVGSRKMMYCIFRNNSNNLFYIGSGSFEVSHSFIDHSPSSFSLPSGINNSLTYRMTYQIQFFNSLHCNADIPLIQSTIDQSQKKSIQETYSQTKQDTLRMTLFRTIDQTIRKTQKNTEKPTPLITVKATPMITVKVTPMITLKETPMNTPNATPIDTPKTTPMNTLKVTPMITVKVTPMITLKVTPMNTPNATSIDTPKTTPMNTLKVSIPRTYDSFLCTNQIVKMKEIRVIFSFFFLTMY